MPETNIQQWKSRPIFLSSTFRDMHAERDHLRQHVFPRLEEELLKRRHHLEWIDLRQGVESGEASTEEEREVIVLKVCLDEIKRSRPFLVVLLGDRYGWVPPADRLNAAVREADFAAEGHSRSVTALEIEYGILKETPDQQRRCFFYFREPLPYDAMPPEVSATYSEQFATDEQALARWGALEDLKKRLNEDDELKPRIRPYSAGWDAEKITVTGLEAWGDQVFEDLWRELDEETREFAARPAPTWEESERDALAEFVEQRSRDFTGRDDLIGQLLELAKSPAVSADAPTANTPTSVSWGACVTGQPGAGKSALFAKLVSELQDDPNVLLLPNAAGTSPRSASVDAMLRRWIGELAAFLGVADPLPENASIEEVDQTFASLMGRASVKQRVVVMLDALNQFEPTPRAKHMTWRPKFWPPNVRLIATELPGAEADSLSQWAGVEGIELPPLTEADAHEIGHRVWQRYHCPWSDAVWQALAAKRLPDDGATAVGNPLWTTLACEQLALLDADDFSRAERQFAEERDPQARLTQLRRDLAQRMPPDVPGLYAWLLAQTEKIHGEAWARAFAVAIALSRHGWRELDMRLLVPALAARLYPETPAAEITSLQLASLRRSFRAHLAVRGENQLWDFFHAQMREAIARNLPSDVPEIRALHAVLADHLLSLSSDDPLRETETMFQLLEADDYSRAAGYYGGDLTEGEARGATAELAARTLAGEAQEPNPVLALLESLLREAKTTELPVLAKVCDRFNFNLDDALACEARLPSLRDLHLLNQRFLEHLAAADPSNTDWQRGLSVSHNRIAGVFQTQGNLAGALAAYRDSLAIIERLTATDPNNTGWQHDQSVIHDNIGDVLMDQGDSIKALGDYRASHAIVKSLFDAEPTNGDWAAGLSTSHERIGNAFARQGDSTSALAAYRASHAIFELLAALNPNTAVCKRNLSSSYQRIGDVLRTQSDATGALQAYRASLAICQGLVVANPGNAKLQSDLCAIYGSIGYVLQAQGDATGALQAYRDSLGVTERLAATDRTNAQLQRGLSVDYEQLGDVLHSQGDDVSALDAYRASLSICQGLVATDPNNAKWRADLSASHDRIGNVFLAQGDAASALDAYRASHVIRDGLTTGDPTNVVWQHDLALSHQKIGDAFVAQQDASSAMAAYGASLAIMERLTATDDRNSDWQRDLAISHDRLGDMLFAQGDAASALAANQASRKISERLAVSDPANAGWQRDFAASLYKQAEFHIWEGDRRLAVVYLVRCRDVLRQMQDRGMQLDPTAAGMLSQLEQMPPLQ